MSDEIIVYGIATCQSCKKARAWLTESGREHKWVDVRDDPPPRARLQRWVKALGAKALRNTSGGSYRALGAEKETWGEAAWIDAYVADPMLIKRPVLEVGGKPVAVGFRESRWTEILAA